MCEVPVSPAGSSSAECLHTARRKVIRDAYDRSGRNHVLEMAERYERERKKGIRTTPDWRSLVRWEVQRIKRKEA